MARAVGDENDADNDVTTAILSTIESKFLTEVANFLSSLSSKTEDDGNSSFQIVNVQRMKSAQQHVFLLKIEQQYRKREESMKDEDITVQNGKQYRDDSRTLKLLKEAIKNNNGKLILRIWENGARWWNLNLKHFFYQYYDNNEIKDDDGDRNTQRRQTQKRSSSNHDDSSILCHDLAKAEVAGYRVAKRALEYYNCRRQTKVAVVETSITDIDSCRNGWVETKVCIPTVVYFQQDNIKNPWGLFSFVGQDSIDVNPMRKNQQKDDDSNQEWVVCEEFIHNMVKIRHEFGFDEPHPRHGRVHTDQSLDYALHVMDTVILPLHSAFFDCYCNKNINNSASISLKEKDDGRKQSFSTSDFQQHPLLQDDGHDLEMINYFLTQSPCNKNKFKEDKNQTDTKACRYGDMVELYQVIMSHLKKEMTSSTFSNSMNQPNQPDCIKKINHRMNAALKILDKCVLLLQLESKELRCCGKNNHLPAVLCHIDLQPQNMILCRNIQSRNSNEIPRIFSVLDWEESCYADPRFELLLLCRKVVATRSQANAIWEKYDLFIQKRFGESFKNNQLERNKSLLGSIEPWLKLETVHSLITLFMQGMNLGGRNPWEGLNELWNKMSREMKRLVDLGWDFINEAIDS